MATWLVHLRVAEIVCNNLDVDNQPLFFAGSIAPDNGFSADISHFCYDSDKKTCDLNLFYDNFINNFKTNNDFYLGYYVHLCTDVYWQKYVIAPLKNENENVKRHKDNWRKVDLEFLLEHSDFIPVLELQKCRDMKKKWLNYDNEDTISTIIENAIYQSQLKIIDKPTDISKNEICSFIDECAQWIIINLKEC